MVSYGGGPWSFSEILYEVDGPAAIITLNRPERLNAFTGAMMNEMIAAFDLADADDAVRAVIVTGAGRGFCAGADLGAGGDTFNDEARGDLGGNTPTLARRDGGGVLVAAHLRLQEAGDRGDQRLGRRRRPDDDAADGRAHPRRQRQARLRVRRPRHRPRRRGELVPAPHRRHQPGARVGAHGPRLPGPGGARRRPRQAGAAGRPRCCRRPRRWSTRSPRARPRSRPSCPAACCGGCSAPTTRWSPTAPTRPPSPSSAARPTRPRA